MKNAYECREQFSREGKYLRRERAIGPIVVWAIVVLIAMATGQLLNIPSAFWHLFK